MSFTERPDSPIEVVAIGKSETDRAAELKARAQKLLIELSTIMDEAMRDGLSIRFASIQLNAWGKHEVVDLHIVKSF